MSTTSPSTVERKTDAYREQTWWQLTAPLRDTFAIALSLLSVIMLMSALDQAFDESVTPSGFVHGCWTGAVGWALALIGRRPRVIAVCSALCSPLIAIFLVFLLAL